MPPRNSSQDQSPASSNPGRRSRPARTSVDAAAADPLDAQAALGGENAPPATGAEGEPDSCSEEEIAGELSFREAQTALELSLAELQAPDLDVERMAGLYRRANRYADRCAQLLQQVEQQVMQWDAGQPLEPPVPYQP